MFYKSDLGKEYLNYCDSKELALKTNILDLSHIISFFPTFILPLSIFIKEHKEITVIFPKKNKISKNIIEIFPKTKLIEKNLKYLLSNQLVSTKNQNAFGYFVGELTDNIFEHSNFSIAYIMAKRYKEFTEIGIIDNGISIPGSYENKKLSLENDMKSLEDALEGISTKSEERGYGLRTSLKILTDGFKAKCLIVSRSAGLIVDKDNRFFYRMEKKNIFNGTLISTRFLNKIGDVNVYDYIEK